MYWMSLTSKNIGVKQINQMNTPSISTALFTPIYLNRSETFIYRQLMGLKTEFDIVVIGSRGANLDLFPIDTWRLFLQESRGFDRLVGYAIRKFHGKRALLSPGQFGYWHKALRHRNVQLIHAHFANRAMTVLPLARRMKLPLLVTCHGYDVNSLISEPGYRDQLRELFDYAHVIAVSQDMRNHLLTLGAVPERTYAHYIGVPMEEFSYIERKYPLAEVVQNRRLEILQVARLEEKKGISYTLHAFKSFLNIYPDSRLTLVGDGSMRPELQAMCTQLGIEDYVRFTGFQPKEQIKDFMAASDIFVHHSITAKNGDKEGIPTTLMEAMATGLICISTYHSGISELIEHAKTGFLVPERDVDSYVKCMLEAVTTTEPIGRQGHLFVEHRFNIEKQNRLLGNIYREIIHEQHNH